MIKYLLRIIKHYRQESKLSSVNQHRPQNTARFPTPSVKQNTPQTGDVWEAEQLAARGLAEAA